MSVGNYCSRCITVSTDWQFLVVFKSFLGFLGSKNIVDTVELNMTETVKKNHRKYRWCFWHLWPLLNLPQGVNFISLFATRWRSHLFFSNLEFWAEIFCGRSIYEKNHFYRGGKPFFPQKIFRRAKNSNSKIILMSWKRLKMTFKINWIHY